MVMVFGMSLGQRTPTWLSLLQKTTLLNVGKKHLLPISIVRSLLTRLYKKKRDGTSGELRFVLEGHAMGVISVDVSADGTRK